MTNEIRHYGTKQHSGRYPWGSGEDPAQRDKDFLEYVRKLEAEGMDRVEIARHLDMSTLQLRQRKSIAKARERQENADLALRLKDKGMSDSAIGRRMGINESSVRALLNPALKVRAEIVFETAKMLRNVVDKKKYVDVGDGEERHIGISKEKLRIAVRHLQDDDGYNVYYVPITQQGTGKPTTIKTLTAPETTWDEVYKNRDQIKMITNVHSEDGGRTYEDLEPPNNISSKRVFIRHEEEGGKLKDGLIELRRGVPDISLGNARYAQVRIAVDGTHFMKGMAMYSDDIPKGFDIVYNTNKSIKKAKEDVFKKQEADPEDPFGTANAITQRHYIDSDGKRKLSALNIVSEEGDWSDWHKTLSSQMLSKQSPYLAKKQLAESYERKLLEFEEIQSLTNPAVRRRLLEPFADSCDSDAVHLKAAALPRQGNHVLLPFPSMSEKEIYAPQFHTGEIVVLIRHPHGGIFEIPQLTVNNNNREAIAALGKDAKDAVGIHPKVAEQLSGADFDGDTVLVIPNSTGAIRRSSPLLGLKNFDPKISYAYPEGVTPPEMKSKTKQLEMGKISNLITDMTIKGATEDKIARAVRHSMVVIDAQKHHLDYKRSFVENGIAALKKEFQGGEKRGAATLISRSKSTKTIPLRKPGAETGEFNPKTGKPKRVYIDPKTGKKLYREAKETYKVPVTAVDKTGRYEINPKTGKKKYLDRVVVGELTKTRMEKVHRMDLVDNAKELSSGTIIEGVYADHANRLKALANKARLAYINTERVEYNPVAKESYKAEVESLKSKLNLALKHSPIERQAQLLAGKKVRLIQEENPDLDPDDLKKMKGKALIQARNAFGGDKKDILITDREWEAIQAGAISDSFLNQILLNSDLDRIKQKALPRSFKSMSPGKISRVKSMLKAGHTIGDIANALGVSISAVEGVLE